MGGVTADAEYELPGLEGPAEILIDRERMLAEMFLNRFHLARDVVDTGVDLATTYPCIQRFDQL